MVTSFYVNDTVIACSDDDILHGVMQDGEDFWVRMSVPVMHEVWGCGGTNPHIPHTHAPIKACKAVSLFVVRSLCTFSHSFVCVQLLTHASIYPSSHPCIRPVIHPSVQSSIQSSMHPSNHPLTTPSNYPLIHLSTYSSNHAFIRWFGHPSCLCAFLL